MRLTLTVDGTRHDIDVDSDRALADVLGAECGVAGYHVACPDGTCGACAAVVDGDTVHSCLMLAVQASDAQVGTLPVVSHPSPAGNPGNPGVTTAHPLSDRGQSLPAPRWSTEVSADGGLHEDLRFLHVPGPPELPQCRGPHAAPDGT